MGVGSPQTLGRGESRAQGSGSYTLGWGWAKQQSHRKEHWTGDHGNVDSGVILEPRLGYCPLTEGRLRPPAPTDTP